MKDIFSLPIIFQRLNRNHQDTVETKSWWISHHYFTHGLMHPPPIYFQLPPTVCGVPQDHSQAQQFARRTDRTQKNCYTHDTVYYTKGMQLEIRKSHMGGVQEKQGTSFQVRPPGGVGQDTLNILSTMMYDYTCELFQLGKPCVQAFIVGQSCTYAASVWVIPATETAVLLSAETSTACLKPLWTTKLIKQSIPRAQKLSPRSPTKASLFWSQISVECAGFEQPRPAELTLTSLESILCRDDCLKSERCCLKLKTGNLTTPLLWASLVAQTGKNPPSMREIQVQSLGWEDPLEKEMANYSSILAWRISMDRGVWQATVHGAAKSQTWLSN